jgi:hypothetical protein
MRPYGVSKHTLENMNQGKQDTISQVSEYFYIKAHQTSARYTKQQNEFKETVLHWTIASYNVRFILNCISIASLVIRSPQLFQYQ